MSEREKECDIPIRACACVPEEVVMLIPLGLLPEYKVATKDGKIVGGFTEKGEKEFAKQCGMIRGLAKGIDNA